MKPVNIYALTRASEVKCIQRFEKQMSMRGHLLPVKKWEINCLSELICHLQNHMEGAENLEFFYSFQIPKLGKEFDLIRIGSETVINIELKSGEVSDEKLLKQLRQNQYYLSTLGLTIRSYTFVESQNRLVRLSNSGNLKEAEWGRLCDDLKKQKDLFDGDIEELFNENNFIISPLAEPERFLAREYFLTSQQRDIEIKILKNIKEKKGIPQGFSGLPGTGKTLLLYDIAMCLSERQRVAIIHCGSFSMELERLDERLKRIDFFQAEEEERYSEIVEYSAVLIDEAHRMSVESFKHIRRLSEEKNLPMVFSYDCEDMISEFEMDKSIIKEMEALSNFVGFRLTNRIRTKSTISAFVQTLLCKAHINRRKDYSSINILYAGDMAEAEVLMKNYLSKNYVYLRDSGGCYLDVSGVNEGKPFGGMYEPKQIVAIEDSTCLEYDKVIMLMGPDMYYDEQGFLRKKNSIAGTFAVRNLFHGLNRAKNEIALLVIDNEALLGDVIEILQGKNIR